MSARSVRRAALNPHNAPVILRIKIAVAALTKPGKPAWQNT